MKITRNTGWTVVSMKMGLEDGLSSKAVTHGSKDFLFLGNHLERNN
jgi:hypothetical protein